MIGYILTFIQNHMMGSFCSSFNLESGDEKLLRPQLEAGTVIIVILSKI